MLHDLLWREMDGAARIPKPFPDVIFNKYWSDSWNKKRTELSPEKFKTPEDYYLLYALHFRAAMSEALTQTLYEVQSQAITPNQAKRILPTKKMIDSLQGKRSPKGNNRQIFYDALFDLYESHNWKEVITLEELAELVDVETGTLKNAKTEYEKRKQKI